MGDPISFCGFASLPSEPTVASFVGECWGMLVCAGVHMRARAYGQRSMVGVAGAIHLISSDRVFC